MSEHETETPMGELLVYQGQHGEILLEVRLQDETVWLTQQMMAELFQTSKQNISHHTQSIFEEGELQADATVKKYLTVRQEGNFPGNKLLKKDVEIAKNYLTEEELNILNRIVTAYLEMAEIQALNRIPMTMQDWSERLHSFLTMTGRELLNHAGTISHDTALEKAHAEYEKYRTIQREEPTEVEKHFIEAEQTTKLLETSQKNGHG